MSAQHTPGPWRVDPFHPGDIQSLSGIEIAMAYRQEDRGARFDFPMNAPFPPEPVSRANVRLMAAAPDLLAACSAFVEWLDSDVKGPVYPDGLARDTHPNGEAIWSEWWALQHELCGRAVDEARAAIAKAKGSAA